MQTHTSWFYVTAMKQTYMFFFLLYCHKIYAKKVEGEHFPIIQLFLMENYVAQKEESVKFIRKAHPQGYQRLLNFFDCKKEQS